LAGGESLRMKPHVWIPKPLVDVYNGMTLLEWQVAWLRKHGFSKIVVLTRGFRLPELDVIWVESQKKWGTGGALRRGLEFCEEEYVYALNCDDILLYDPRELYKVARKGVVVTVTRPYSPWGVVNLRRNKIVGFTEKPILNFWVSTGHYLWHRETAIEYLPTEGDLEKYSLPRLAEKGLCWAYRLENWPKRRWYTINTYKDLINVRNILSSIELFD